LIGQAAGHGERLTNQKQAYSRLLAGWLAALARRIRCRFGNKQEI